MMTSYLRHCLQDTLIAIKTLHLQHNLPVLAKLFKNNDCTKRYFSDTNKIMTSSFTGHDCCNQNFRIVARLKHLFVAKINICWLLLFCFTTYLSKQKTSNLSIPNTPTFLFWEHKKSTQKKFFRKNNLFFTL